MLEARIGNVGLNLRRLLRTFSDLQRLSISMSQDILFHGKETDNKLLVVVILVWETKSAFDLSSWDNLK